MNNLVKIKTSTDGEIREADLQFWHYVADSNGDPCTLCQGEFFGFGQSGCEYELKSVKVGGITCPDCLAIIKKIKAIKL